MNVPCRDTRTRRVCSGLLLAMPVFASQSIVAAAGDDGPAYGPELEGFNYRAPVRQFEFISQGAALHMAYLGVAPTVAANGRAEMKAR